MSVWSLSLMTLLLCLVSTHPEVCIKQSISTRFLIELHVHGDGEREYGGIFIYKDRRPRKLLDSCRVVTILYQPHAIAYIGAKDGIYVYDDSTEKLEKYGTIDDSIIGIAKSNNTDTLYIITEDHSVYKVTEGGTKKTKVEGVEDVESIELDWDDNLYFIGTDNQPYVVTVDGVKKIQGLPPNEIDANLYKTLPSIDGLNLVWGRVIYYIYSDGTSRLHELSAEEKAMDEEDIIETRKFVDGLVKENLLNFRN